jgi:hypothetical protein
VKVRADRLVHARLPWRASLAALASALVALLGLFPTTAHAITRTDVLSRAHTWVARKVTYSQTSHFAGYRRDCSGFVSMAWQLGRSYTSRTIHAVATRVPLSKLRPGDAVHTPGHVALFVKWTNKAHTRYVAMEESTWGHPAMHHVRPLGRGATGLRYRHISDGSIVVAAAPLTGVSPPPSLGGIGAADAIPSAVVSASADATAAASVLTTGTAAASLLTSAAPTLFFAPGSQPIGTFALIPLD